MPPYIVFADTSLKDMAVKRPQSLEEFELVYGVGKEKLERYGKVFVDEIVAFAHG